MKKILMIFAALLCIFVSTGCGTRTYKTITFDEYKSKIDNKESFILFIGSETCSHCTEFKKTINEVLKEYNVEINYIDISKFTVTESEKFNAMVKFTGTPTTVFYENGVEEHPSYNRISGSRSYSEVVKALKKNGYIKED